MCTSSHSLTSRLTMMKKEDPQKNHHLEVFLFFFWCFLFSLKYDDEKRLHQNAERLLIWYEKKPMMKWKEKIMEFLHAVVIVMCVILYIDKERVTMKKKKSEQRNFDTFKIKFSFLKARSIPISRYFFFMPTASQYRISIRNV